MMEPSTSESASRDGDAPCLSCTAICWILKPGDKFHCHTCNNVAISVMTTHADLPPPPEPTNGNNECRPSVRDLFNQVTGKSATQRLAGTQVSFKLACNEVLAEFSSCHKVAEYQKLGRGPTPQAVGNPRKVRRHSTNFNNGQYANFPTGRLMHQAMHPSHHDLAHVLQIQVVLMGNTFM